jgi:hypothetical protein
LQAFFEQASKARAEVCGARQAFKPRQVAGTLYGLVRDLQHVELLLLNLDGFDNVGRLVDNLGIAVHSNEGALADIDNELTGVASALQLVHGDIINLFG